MRFDYQEFRDSPLPAMEDVVANWPKGPLTALVSVICITYNQRDYVEDALRGFVLQQTGFPFEIIVHDDASTDGTAAMVQAWARRYPGLIKAVCQTENQYSQGHRVLAIAASHAGGRYLAFCEGDDFWVDRCKLANQVAAMEKYPDVQLCFHRCLLFGTAPAGLTRSVRKRPSVIGLGEIVRGGGGYIPTPSIMVRREVMESLPPWFRDAPVGDYFIQMLGSVRGALYLPEIMSSYRILAANSWSANLRTASAAGIETLAQRQDISLGRMRSQLGDRYSEDFRYARARSYRFYAHRALIAGHPGLARSLIEKSWAVRRWTSLSQVVIYVLRYGLGPLGRLLNRQSVS